MKLRTGNWSDEKYCNWLTALKEVRGSAESALVMIPLTTVFLGVLQISSFAVSHGISSNEVQGTISRTSLFRNTSSFPENSIGPTTNIRRVDLPGGGSILISSREKRESVFSIFFSGISKFTVNGIAIDEN